MVNIDDVIHIYHHLQNHGIHVWLTGGWGIDALLSEQTRPHHDLDIILLLDDIVRMGALLSQDGYILKELWSENRTAVDAQGVATDTAFVLQDAQGRELDAHALHLDAQGNGIPDWDAEGMIFEKKDLAGEGIIAGFNVRCLSPEMQVVCHTGYQLPDTQKRDLELLKARILD